MTDPEELYTVFCGYELDPCDLMRDGINPYPQTIAADLPFSDAAHILRTLLEKGESDMNYYMIPARMFAHWGDEKHDTHNGEPVNGEPVLHRSSLSGVRRALVEQLFQHYLDAVHTDSGLAVDEEWSEEELYTHILTALRTEPDPELDLVLDERECPRCGKLHTSTETTCEDCRTALA